MSTDASAGRLFRQGLDLVLDWADAATARLHNWRDSREGVRGELTLSQNGIKYSWGSWNLASTTTRDQLAKRLTGLNPEVPWAAHLEEAAWRFTQLARVGEPLTVLTGTMAAETEMLLPGWLYAGQPTLLYADGDTGKSLTALAFAVAMTAGIALPGGLVPRQATPTAYLDWETSEAVTNQRLGLIATGFGIPPPPVLYKHMTRPLVEEIGPLAAELAHRHVGFVVIDSKMFAVAIGDSAAYHEPITAFYSALRLFAPAAVLVLNHVTNAEARTNTPARPFGGAFAFNGPRMIWEAKRDWEIEDRTAVVFTCRKANNMARKPTAFGLQFTTADSPDMSGQLSGCPAIRVDWLDLSTVQPLTLAGASLSHRILTMLSEPLSVEALVEALRAKPDSIARTLRRLKENRRVADLTDGRWLALPDMSGTTSGTTPIPDQDADSKKRVSPNNPFLKKTSDKAVTTSTTRSKPNAKAGTDALNEEEPDWVTRLDPDWLTEDAP